MNSHVTPWNRLVLPLVLAILLPALVMGQISVEVSANFPPPELPVYDQPPIPADGYLWTPGYWAWSDDDQDYFWVPGTWVQAPQPEYLWTPGYWGMDGAIFLWHAGYWGPHVGFYGGVNYGCGYNGLGYEGSYWQGGRLYYNRAVNNINNTSITNVYNKTVINNVTVNRVSFNGGDGVHAQPSAAQLAAARERHIEPTPLQRQHVNLARSNVELHASQNQGHPPIAATPRPAAFSGPGVVHSRAPGTFNVVHQNAPAQPAGPRSDAGGRADSPPGYQGSPRQPDAHRNEAPPRPPAARGYAAPQEQHFDNRPREAPPPQHFDNRPREAPTENRPAEPRREPQMEERRPPEPPPQPARPNPPPPAQHPNAPPPAHPPAEHPEHGRDH